MEVAAIVISLLSLLLAGLVFLRTEARWGAERARNVQVAAWHDGMGFDAYPDREEVEHLIAVRVTNLGERPEHVMVIGMESPSGEPIADDRPKAAKIVDEPPPGARELPPRGQIAARFKVSPKSIAEGFIGYALLGTGERIYSEPTAPAADIGEIQGMIRGAIAEAASKGTPPGPRTPPSGAA